MASHLPDIGPDFTRLSEAELIAEALAGRRGAFSTIMQRHNQPLFRVARGILADDAEAEDLVQETYVRAFAALDTFRGEASLLTWLTRIAINEARERLRRRKRQTLPLDQVDLAQAKGAEVVGFPGGQPMENPETAAARSQIRFLLERAVDDLDEPFRLVFILREVQGCSVEETAALLELRPETVKSRLHRARKQLRAALHERLESSMRGTFPFLGRRCARITETVLDRVCPQPIAG